MHTLALIALLAVPAAPAPTPSPKAGPAAASAPVSPLALYSKRALRRARLLIQMEMLELRDERLGCVRAALLRQLPPGLRPQEPTTWSRTTTNSSACLLQL